MAKAAAKKTKTPTDKDFIFFGFNIKLISNERQGTFAYTEIIRDMFTKDIYALVGSDKAMLLRNQFSQTVIWKEQEYEVIYGKITRYTTLEGANWYNKTKRDYQTYEVPLDIFPSGFETDYYFIPAAHRFFIRKSPKVSFVATERFLNLAIKQVITPKEDFRVNIIKSQDVIDKIIDSKELRSLIVHVTYTNDDIGEDAEQWADELLKDGQIGRIDATFKPDQNGTLETNNKLIRGLLEISKENGTAEARIINQNGRKETVITESHAEKIIVKTNNEGTILQVLFSQMMKLYGDE